MSEEPETNDNNKRKMSQTSDNGDEEGNNHKPLPPLMKLPQKKNYRQRAHSNPIGRHNLNYPVSPEVMNWSTLYPKDFLKEGNKRVEFLDVGCGYGGLLIELSPLYPNSLMLGMEIRVKVSNFVKDKIAALRNNNPGEYNNVACLRMNAMKYLPNYFYKGQLKKMFFLFPDPHFKKSKHRWRIINESLLAEYAYVLAEGGFLYTVTDVEDLHVWMRSHLSAFPLFKEADESEVADDIASSKLLESTDEGRKVSRNSGSKYVQIFKRIARPPSPSEK